LKGKKLKKGNGKIAENTKKNYKSGFELSKKNFENL